MASSYEKRTWFHQTVGLLSLIILAYAYALLVSKQQSCYMPLLSRDEITRWEPKKVSGTELSAENFNARNQTAVANDLIYFVQHYYDLVRYFHIVLLVWCLVVILLGWINIVPKHEDFKVLVILLTIFFMGLMALFAFGTAFIAFHKPCREPENIISGRFFEKAITWVKDYYAAYVRYREMTAQLHNGMSTSSTTTSTTTSSGGSGGITTTTTTTTTDSSAHGTLTSTNVNHTATLLSNPITMITTTGRHTSGGNITTLRQSYLPHFTQWMVTTTPPPPVLNPQMFKLEFRAIKDKRPVNVYEDDDETMTLVTLIDSGTSFILLCSTFLHFFDTRQHMIEWRN